ncbi:hypothetical protein GQ43DRAFT_427021 [Delitschia confertaspora ATCC 74209]|uniref:Uncharacterized protein n=1 Tax=Delitschia confertaspora ATCC 74209 TaxID=1513339 RepID=A0A9P4JBJ5_9PLEO|nr:hypothetical protein GQ43DRAFT_427021 [Delitschia confertaspora ATCC 74209]
MLGILFQVLVSVIQKARSSNVGLLSLYIVGAFTLWVLWRLWTFSLSPKLWPNRPLMLPYKFPLLGHTLQFLKNPEDLIQNGK